MIVFNTTYTPVFVYYPSFGCRLEILRKDSKTQALEVKYLRGMKAVTIRGRISRE